MKSTFDSELSLPVRVHFDGSEIQLVELIPGQRLVGVFPAKAEFRLRPVVARLHWERLPERELRCLEYELKAELARIESERKDQ